jgi:hypothetical protein
LLLGVVEETAPPPITITAALSQTSRPVDVDAAPPVAIVEDTGAPKRGRGRKKAVAKKTATTKVSKPAAPVAVAAPAVAVATAARPAKSRRGRGKKKAVAATVDG